MKCVLCDIDQAYFSNYLCGSCEDIKKVVSMYGAPRMLDIVQTICVRDKDQIENQLKKVQTRSQKSAAL